MRPNRLRELLDTGSPTLGTRIQSSWPTVVELIGSAGTIDYVEFLAAYSPYDLYALDNLGRAIALFDHLSGMTKIEAEPRTHLATRAVGAGLQNLLFADVRSAADARDCLAAVRPDTPESRGRHGVAMRRDVGTVLEVGSRGFADALERAVVALMIEKESALEELESILAIPGVDMVVFGPGDYAMNVGLTGEIDHPRVREAEEHVIATAHRVGVAFRAEIDRLDQAQRYLELGVRHFAIGVDTVVLFDYWKRSGSAMLEALGRGTPGRAAGRSEAT